MNNKKKKLDNPALHREIIRQTKQLNPEITIKFLAELFEVSDKTIETWIYEDKGHPHIGHTAMLWYAVRFTSCKAPRDLYRLSSLLFRRGRQAAKKLPAGKPEFTGKKLQPQKYFFIYQNQRLGISEIARAAGMPAHSLRYRIDKHNIAPESDITDFANEQILPPGEANTQYRYIYNGEELTLREICTKIKINRNTAYKRITAAKLKSGDDITELINRPVKKRSKKQ